MMETKKQFSHKAIPIAKIELRGPVTYEPRNFFEQPEGIKDRYIIDYDVKLSNVKNLQRDLVWTIDQKRNLIESLLKKTQIPEFHVAQYKSYQSEENGRKVVFKIIDGKQRLSTIQQFMNDEFTFIWNGIEYLYSEFDEDSKYFIWNAPLYFKIVYEYDDKRLTDKQLIDWFYMVNFAGTQQDKTHMENLYKTLEK